MSIFFTIVIHCINELFLIIFYDFSYYMRKSVGIFFIFEKSTFAKEDVI